MLFFLFCFFSLQVIGCYLQSEAFAKLWSNCTFRVQLHLQCAQYICLYYITPKCAAECISVFMNISVNVFNCKQCKHLKQNKWLISYNEFLIC